MFNCISLHANFRFSNKISLKFFSCLIVQVFVGIMAPHRTGDKQSSHYNDIIMSAMASQFTGVSNVCSIVGSGADQRKHQSPASQAFVREIHRWPVNSPHKRPVTRKMFSFDVVIMWSHDYRADWRIHVSTGLIEIHTRTGIFMMTSSNGNIFRVIGSLRGEFTGHRRKGQWRRGLMFFYDLGLNERLSKQSWGWWIETPSHPLWRHSNARRHFQLHVLDKKNRYILISNESFENKPSRKY